MVLLAARYRQIADGLYRWAALWVNDAQHEALPARLRHEMDHWLRQALLSAGKWESGTFADWLASELRVRAAAWVLEAWGEHVEKQARKHEWGAGQAEVEDTIGVILGTVWQKLLQGGAPPDNPRAWLSLVARHAGINASRARHHRREGTMERLGDIDTERTAAEPLAGEGYGDLADPERRVLKAEGDAEARRLAQEARRLVQDVLTDAQWAVYALRMQKIPYGEIGHLLGIGEGAARKRHADGLRRLEKDPRTAAYFRADACRAADNEEAADDRPQRY